MCWRPSYPRFRKRQLTSRAKSQKRRQNRADELRLQEAALLKTEAEKLQSSQATSILDGPAAAEERNGSRRARTDSINRAEQGKNHGLILQQSTAEISELPRKRTQKKFKFRIQPMDHATSNRQSSHPLPHTIQPKPRTTDTHQIHERPAGWIQLRSHESSKERWAMPAQWQSYERTRQVHPRTDFELSPGGAGTGSNR